MGLYRKGLEELRKIKEESRKEMDELREERLKSLKNEGKNLELFAVVIFIAFVIWFVGYVREPATKTTIEAERIEQLQTVLKRVDDLESACSAHFLVIKNMDIEIERLNRELEREEKRNLYAGPSVGPGLDDKGGEGSNQRR